MNSEKGTLNSYCSRYIESVFAKRLQKEGFVSIDSLKLCWYRMNPEGLINSVVFYTPYSRVPVDLCIGYGIFPTFSMPVMITSAYYAKRPIADPERFQEQAIIENVPPEALSYRFFSPDILVEVPSQEGRGIYTFDGIILPRMNSVHSIDDAYSYHKEMRIKKASQFAIPAPESRFGILSQTFVRMALYLDDYEMYPYCFAQANREVERLGKLVTLRPKRKELKNALEDWRMIQQVFQSDARKNYLCSLEKMKTDNTIYLQRRCGIPICSW